MQIYGGGAYDIRYTLDGSDPTLDDAQYIPNTTILLKDVSSQENVYSARDDLAAGQQYDLAEKYSTINPVMPFTVPDFLVDKANVVRVSVFDREGNLLQSICGVYFIDLSDDPAYDGIYVVSVVSDPVNLFDSKYGIYVTGDAFEKYKEALVNDEFPKNYRYYWWWEANYRFSGIEWERPAQIMIFDEERNLVLSQDSGIRIQGGGSRGYLPHSLRCYAREEYSGSDEFDMDIFGENITPHKFILSSGGDDIIIKIRDRFTSTLGKDLNIATMDFIPCAVFLNGEYWGTCHITEDFNKDYIHDHYGVNEDNVIMIKNGAVKEGNPEDLSVYEDMKTFITTNDMSNPTMYSAACDLIDIDSYLDYYALQMYIGRYGDWPSSNYALWRTRKTEDTQYGDCKWRWMLFDSNTGSMDFTCLPMDPIDYVLANDTVFASLFENEDFRVALTERILYMVYDVFSVEACHNFADTYFAQMQYALMASNMRFHNSDRAHPLEMHMYMFHEYVDNRLPVIWESLKTNMGAEWLEAHGFTEDAYSNN